MNCFLRLGSSVGVTLLGRISKYLQRVPQLVVQLFQSLLLAVRKSEQKIDGDGRNRRGPSDGQQDRPQRRHRILAYRPPEQPVQNITDREVDDRKQGRSLCGVLPPNPRIEQLFHGVACPQNS